MNELRPGTFVEEGNLTQNISVLRKILAESAEGGQCIQTIPRRGYRFVGRIQRAGEELIVEEHSRSSIVCRKASTLIRHLFAQPGQMLKISSHQGSRRWRPPSCSPNEVYTQRARD